MQTAVSSLCAIILIFAHVGHAQNVRKYGLREDFYVYSIVI